MDKRQPSRNAELGLSTRAIHLGYDPAEEHGALTPPIFMTSTYAFESAEDGSELFRGERAGYIYGRTRNPTQALLEGAAGQPRRRRSGARRRLGHGRDLGHHVDPARRGRQVVIDHTLYGSTYAFFTRGLTKFGIGVRPVDFTVPARWQRRWRRGQAQARLLREPANPNLRVIDIAAVAALAKSAGALSIVDNTFASPALQRPLELGADLVVHSATKFLGGHGDLLGGAVVGSSALVDQIAARA